MAQKLFDIAAKTGEYMDQQGNAKGRWQNVGAVMQGNDGGQFIMLAAWFNPAGLPRKEGSESVLLSCFTPQDRQQQGGQQAPRQAAPQPQRTAPAPHRQAQAHDDFGDDVPF